MIAPPASANNQEDERILQYDSHIEVNGDASLNVREKMVVRALGEQIRHGIYRDFPIAYRDHYGNRYRVHFALYSAERDGAPERARVEQTTSGVRIYLGDKNASVAPGNHEYVLNYRVTRELGFFSDHDELYWNVTGNAWGFPIDRTTATVVLPTAIPRSRVHLEGYSGPKGAREHDFSAVLDNNGEMVFTATRAFAPGEGLTIVVTWPKGYITEPSTQQRLTWMLEDNRAGAVALLGLLLVVLYESIAWWMVGRDPKPGVIMPLYEPPAALSPAAARFVAKMHFDDKAFAAQLVSLAAKGYLEISEENSFGSTYVLRKTGRAVQLAPDEKLVADRLFEGGTELRLESANHLRVSAARKALQTSLATTLEKIYFVTNGKYLLPGLIGSALTYVAVVAAAEPQGRPIALFMTLWLSMWTVGVAMLAVRVVSLWRGAFHSRGLAKINYIGAIFMTAFALPFFAGEVFGLATFGWSVSFIALAALAAIAAANFIFHELLKAPTHSGRELLDKIDGFKMFLGAVSDKDRPGIVVNRDVATFEKYLPYAIALDLEEQWTAKFAQALAAAASANAGSAATAAVHAGALASLVSSAGGISGFAGSLAGAVGSASTAPGSSSGSGGGGSSGGGGGGGGGGGW